MSEAPATEAAGKAKSKTEYTPVTMTDGRVVQFPGKRAVDKTTLIDETKFEIDEAAGIAQASTGAVSLRMDFRNGETRTIPLPLSLLLKFAGHGAEQKFGDELATTTDKPMSDADRVEAIDVLAAEIAKGNWGKARAEGGGAVAGASLVLRAIMEVNNVGRPENGKPVLDIAAVKAYVDGLLAKEAAKPEGQGLSRRELYQVFRSPGAGAEPTKLSVRIAELEKAEAAKKIKPEAAAVAAEAENI